MNHWRSIIGDTGYSDDFVATRERLGAPDFAFIPIGAYNPRWFMKNQHVNPAEAVQVALDLQVPKAFGMHWGTFILTDEPVIEPRVALAEALQNRGGRGLYCACAGKYSQV